MPSSVRQAVIDFVTANPSVSRKEIQRRVAPGVSDTTLWRVLKRLISENRLEVTGRGPSTRYSPAGAAVIRAHLQIPYNRRKAVKYDKTFIDRYVPNKTFYLPERDRKLLRGAGSPVGGPLPAGTYARRILERLLVDLAWASSRMEGNTYNILETERLIRLGEEALGKDRKEAVMILNHKEAIQYVVDHLGEITLSAQDLQNIHALLSNGLLIDPAMAGRLRRMPAGIGASSYQPLDDQYEIEDEFRILVGKAGEIADPFEQSFFLLVHIPYLQAFEDVNKRTSRIASNVPLLKADLAPMSFLTMNDRDYIDGLIGIYELTNVALLRDAYIEAYIASAQSYKTLRAEVESPDKAALVYRDLVREIVRRAVLDWKEFRSEAAMAMAADAGVPQADQQPVVTFALQEFNGLHEGNLIRYRLQPADLDATHGRTH